MADLLAASLDDLLTPMAPDFGRETCLTWPGLMAPATRLGGDHWARGQRGETGPRASPRGRGRTHPADGGRNGALAHREGGCFAHWQPALHPRATGMLPP